MWRSKKIDRLLENSKCKGNLKIKNKIKAVKCKDVPGMNDPKIVKKHTIFVDIK